MPKARQVFVCRSCEGVQARWMGKCPDCGAWDTLDPQRSDAAAIKDPQRGVVEGWPGAEDVAGMAARARPIGELEASPRERSRIATGIGELDRVLGGGLVPGSAVLVGGTPGIGKSTLMLQAAGAVSAAGTRVLYVASEESAEQVRMRARRLEVPATPEAGANLFILADTNLSRIVEQARRINPAVLVIDSVQMIYRSDVPAAPGSITQLRRCCAELVYLAKLSGMAVVLVGHVTKDGVLAGPRLLEHVVDAVLYFEGDRYHAHRIVRAVKNRFGATLEIGIFEMTGAGLREAPEGASLGVVRGDSPRPGSVVCPVLTGTRCVLVEVQALTATGFLGSAKRKSSGLDTGRLAMIIAVLEQHGGLRLADRDVFVSAVGGLRIGEPAADLALLLAIAGAHYKRALPPGAAVVGEVGLNGEVRPVPQLRQRAQESARLGFASLVVPDGAEAELAGVRAEGIARVRTISQAIEQLG